MTAKTPRGPYEVGHGKPPKTTRFSKGTSGNPSGRPKTAAAPTSSVFDEAFNRTMSLEKNGRARSVSIEEGLQTIIMKQAFAGHRVAVRHVFKLIQARECDRAAAAPVRGARLVVDHKCDGKIDEVLQLLKIAQSVQEAERDRVKLCSWGVREALSRRPPDAKPIHVISIRRAVVDPDAVDWPPD